MYATPCAAMALCTVLVHVRPHVERIGGCIMPWMSVSSSFACIFSRRTISSIQNISGQSASESDGKLESDGIVESDEIVE